MNRNHTPMTRDGLLPLHVIPMQSLIIFLFSFPISPFALFWKQPQSSSSNLIHRELEALRTTMAFAHYLLAVPVEPSKHPKPSLRTSSPSLFSSSSQSLHSIPCATFSSLRSKAHALSILPRFRRIGHKGISSSVAATFVHLPLDLCCL